MTRKKLSGHGDLHDKVLTKNQMDVLMTDDRVLVSIQGETKKITPGNIVRGNVIRWYRRSDTKKVSVRNFARDASMKTGNKSRKGRGFEGDNRYIKSRDGMV